MAIYFKITAHQNSDNLHSRLDGSSAHEHLYALEKRCRFSSRAIIYREGLREVDPFGLSVFQADLKSLKQERRCRAMLFTNDHAGEPAPEESKDTILS